MGKAQKRLLEGGEEQLKGRTHQQLGKLLVVLIVWLVLLDWIVRSRNPRV